MKFRHWISRPATLEYMLEDEKCWQNMWLRIRLQAASRPAQDIAVEYDDFCYVVSFLYHC